MRAIADYQAHAPERFSGGAQESEQLLVWSNGRPLTREDLQQILTRAAEACGDDPSRIGSHSLRFGGATALWAATGDSALVQRWGRWKSDAFHGYLWEARENARGITSSMLDAQVSVL